MDNSQNHSTELLLRARSLLSRKDPEYPPLPEIKYRKASKGIYLNFTL